MGEERADQGSVRTSPSDLGLGYLAQALAFKPGATVGDVRRQAIDGLQEAERHVEALTQRLSVAEGPELNGLMEAYAEALTGLEMVDGYRARARNDAALAALGVTTARFVPQFPTIAPLEP